MNVPTDCLACDVKLIAQHRKPGQGSRRHAGRGLCQRCYGILEREGWLEEFPRVYRRNADLMEDWAELRDDGVTHEVAAKRLGVTEAALERARQRALARGDTRGRLMPFGRPRAA